MERKKAAAPNESSRFSGKRQDAGPSKSQSKQTDSQGPKPVRGSANPGVGSAIERLHGVTTRQERPIKRQKVGAEEDSVPEWAKDMLSEAKRGGVLGGNIFKTDKTEAVTSQQQVTKTSSKAAESPVDLTKEDEDLEVVSDSAMVEVCYGMVSAKINAHQIPYHAIKATAIAQDYWPQVTVTLEKSDNARNIVITAKDTYKYRFGHVDSQTAQGLAPIMNHSTIGIRLHAYIPSHRKAVGEIQGAPCSTSFDLKCNVYGLKRYAEQIGKHLAKHNVWLRNPFQVHRGYSIHNPHANAPINKPLAIAKPSTGGSTSSVPAYRTVEELRSDVVSMFDKLAQHANLPEMEPDSRVQTSLMKHQKQGLHFMTTKEKPRVYSSDNSNSDSLWRLRTNGKTTAFYNIVSGHTVTEKPAEVLGGILGDEMGLGKSLSILSLIVTSQKDSISWASGDADQKPGMTKAKTTLLVVPLSLLANWEQEIKDHLQPDTLSFYIFHGPNRDKNIRNLVQHDIVLTTYNILSPKGNTSSAKIVNPLKQIQWFRVVLDEAHTIRENSTKAHEAACELEAQRRWAVTGTPLQNKLEDVGSLFKFVRLEPFHTSGGFAKYFTTPFKAADPHALSQFRVAVGSITLRRLRDRINLPSRKDVKIMLDMSESERKIYDFFVQLAKTRVEKVSDNVKTTGRMGSVAYGQVLKSITCLRLLCAHGQELLDDDDRAKLQGLDESNAIDLEDDSTVGLQSIKARVTVKEAINMLLLMRETTTDDCRLCKRKIGEVEDDENEDADRVIGHMPACYDIVCHKCVASFQKQMAALASSSGKKFATCPICAESIEPDLLTLTSKQVDKFEADKLSARSTIKKGKKHGEYHGPHTKTKKLIEDLEISRKESEEKPDEPPIKSVVFSTWTTHLDLIAVALDNADMTYVRLDGTMARKNRAAALQQFREDPTIRVFLITVGAGSVGLNLTTASRAYLMEPLWNPASEAQAVDRIYRIGQTREVICTRYLMADSFDLKMLQLQQKKQKLADMSFSSKLDRPETAKEKLQNVRELFK